MFKKTLIILITLNFLVVFPTFNTKAVGGISAYSYVLYDPISQSVLASRNSKERRSMASTTKIMTGLLLSESGDLSKTIKTTKKMVMIEGTSCGFLPEDVISYESLLYGLMLESGNDAALIIAHALAGSPENFAKLMNNKAQEIGMSDTNFVTANGLDHEDHYTTAYDMALLTAYAMQNEVFAKVVGTKRYRAVYNDSNSYRTFYNHNRLLGSYEGIEGVKTGFTKKSGRCLVTSCNKNGARLIVVTLNAPGDWNDHKMLYNFGFEQFDWQTINAHKATIGVQGGVKSKIELKSIKFKIFLLKGSNLQIDKKIYLPPFVYAPIEINENLGKIEYEINSINVGVKALKTTSGCEKISEKKETYPQKLWKIILELL